MKKVDRNTDYDFLRFIGIACIILAHVGVNGVMFQIRNFDVPLMVLLSGISFSQFSSKNYSSYISYIQSRFLRLVIPAWVFLILYDSAMFIYSDHLPSYRDMIMQLTLTGGVDIGVWIIRIFFTMALIAPICLMLNSKIKSNKLFFIYAIISWLFYEFAIILSKEMLPNKPYVLLQIVVFFTYSYGVILMYGMRLAEISRAQLKKHVVLFAAIFSAYIAYNYLLHSTISATQTFKYPPQLYYISYAILVSLILIYLTLHTNIFDPLKSLPIVGFIGKSTMWIYLWHWLCLRVYSVADFELPIIAKYILVFIAATAIAFLQFKIIKIVQLKANFSQSNMSRLNKIFIG